MGLADFCLLQRIHLSFFYAPFGTLDFVGQWFAAPDQKVGLADASRLRFSTRRCSQRNSTRKRSLSRPMPLKDCP